MNLSKVVGPLMYRYFTSTRQPNQSFTTSTTLPLLLDWPNQHFVDITKSIFPRRGRISPSPLPLGKQIQSEIPRLADGGHRHQFPWHPSSRDPPPRDGHVTSTNIIHIQNGDSSREVRTRHNPPAFPHKLTLQGKWFINGTLAHESLCKPGARWLRIKG